MLILIILSFIGLLYFVRSQFIWPLLCFYILILFLTLNSSMLNSSLVMVQTYSISDSSSLFIVYLLLLIIFIAYLNSLDYGSYKLIRLVFLSLTLFCFEVFTTAHLFKLYFYYEASLIPILYIIIKWGSYPERSLRALIMLLYTLFFGAPVLVLIIYFYRIAGRWLYLIYVLDSSFLFTLFVFLCFSVKLPIYGLHFWLPIAHVEAPTFGSVILARILLKLGGIGLLRLSNLIDTHILIGRFLSYFIIFTIYSSLVCCYQSDLKRLIAYSSVAHIIVIPFLIISNNILSIQALVLVMLLHGLSSTLLFISVGILYNIFSSRQLLLIRGLILVSPLFSFILIITFLFTLSAPPLPSYIAEVFFILSSFRLRSYIIYVVILFAFLGLVYNLNWLIRTLFGPSSDMCYSNSIVRFTSFFQLVLTLLRVLPFCSLFYILWCIFYALNAYN